MDKIWKLLKATVVFLIVAVFCLTFNFISTDGNLYAQGGKIKVYIDAGHGGRDPGAVRFGLLEKDTTLDISLRLKSKLEANGFEVVMTRTDDSYSTLDERVNKANSSGADIFLSIHNNAALSEYAHGTETYWNANGVNGSSQFANLIQSNLLAQIGRANRGVKTANFRVIKYTTMPAALVECAFVSNPTENELLKTAGFREKIAVGLYNGIVAFSKGIDKSSGSSSSESYSDSSSKESTGFTVRVIKPESSSVVTENFTLSGWAADLKNTPPLELKKIELYKGSERNESNLLGNITSFKDNILGTTGIVNGGWEDTIEIDKLNEGENIIYAYAYDKNNNYSMANVKINVIKNGETIVNLSPVANPGGPYTAGIEEEIAFDGSGSSDQDGTIAQYLWDFGDGETGSEVKPVHAYSEAGEYTVKLKVTDDKGASSAEVSTTVTIEDEESEDEGTEDESSDGQLGTVSNKTSIVGYIDLTVDDLVKIFEERNPTKVEWARRIAPIYIKYGKLFDIRADIAWAQMCHETGFLEYTGDVKPNQNNFCGMGATGGGVPGNTFSTEELGVIAHYAHLAWYYYPGHINEYCSSQYDPRHSSTHLRYTGDTTLGFLNGQWAPGSNYTDKIIQFANEIIQGINQTDTSPDQSVTASAGDNKTADKGSLLTFDASQSTVSPLSEDVVITYSWDWDGDGTYDETVSEPVITHTYDEEGTYTVTLKVTAFDDVTSTDTLTVTINNPNQIPTADPGGPYTVTAGKELTLDGSGSSDSDGSVAEYTWDFGDSSTGSGVNPVHTYTAAGEYTVTLTVKDNKGAASAEATATVTVEEDEAVIEVNVAPVANPGGPYSVKVDEEITFDGSGSSDSDGTITEYIWDFGDSSTGSGVNPVHTYAATGEYTVTLTVKDDEDLLSEEVTTTATIEVIEESSGDNGTDEGDEEEEQQSVTASAGDDKTADKGSVLTFDASGSTISPLSEDVVITYSWDWDGDGTYDETVSESVITHTYDESGTYTVTLKVTAFDDVSSTDTLTVTVNKLNEIPIADAGGPYTATAGKELTLDGSGSSDSDGSITEYTWDFGDSSTGSGLNPVHTYTAAGEYTVTLTVKDDEGASSEAASTKATVKEAEKTYPVNTSPITNQTSVVGYTEVTVDQLVKIFEDRNSTKVEWARRIAPLYIKYGKLFNIRADIAWAMMCHETGFLEYTGDVKPNQNNFCGMGATGGGVPGNSFATEELGIIAQYAHLAWYYYPDHVNIYCSAVYDPRHFGTTHYRYTGDTTLGFLNGRWAPGATYTDKIILFANQIYGY